MYLYSHFFSSDTSYFIYIHCIGLTADAFPSFGFGGFLDKIPQNLHADGDHHTDGEDLLPVSKVRGGKVKCNYEWEYE